MSKKKPNSRDIMDLFVEKFEGDKPFTPSQHRMNGIKLSQLRKNVKRYIEDNNIETNLSVNEIIIDTIEYSSMIGMNLGRSLVWVMKFFRNQLNTGRRDALF